MFNVGCVLLAVALVSLVLGIGLYFEKPFVKLYDKFNDFMENMLEKIFE